MQLFVIEEMSIQVYVTLKYENFVIPSNIIRVNLCAYQLTSSKKQIIHSHLIEGIHN